MRFLTDTKGTMVINLDKIETVSINPSIAKNGLFNLSLITARHAYNLLEGDYQDIRICYVNLVKTLLNMDIPNNGYIPSDNLLILQKDGTFICEESSIWCPDGNVEDVQMKKVPDNI